ncbi:MAG: hypothetical protein V8T65_04140 [Roseburia inulinivorans]
MNISVLHATETEPVENAWCVFRAEQQNHQVRDREIFSEKQLEEGYRLACQSYPTGVYEIEIPRKRKKH